MNIFRFLDIMLLLLVLLLPSEMLVQVGADEECEYRSAHFTGPCFGRDKECYGCCQEEGFDRGSCKGFLLRHCICTKPCGSSGGSPTYEPPPPPEEDVPPPPEKEAPAV